MSNNSQIHDSDYRWSDDIDRSQILQTRAQTSQHSNQDFNIGKQNSSYQNSNIEKQNSSDQNTNNINNNDLNIDNNIDNNMQKLEKSKKEEDVTITKSDIQDIKNLLKNIITILRDTYGFKKYPYDEKSTQATERGTALVYKYRNYYDVINTIKKAGPIDPQDFDSPVYNAERIFDVLERYSDIIYVINDGTEPLFIVISHEGKTNFSKESIILPGEIKQFYNTYELRLRSPTIGHPYRVTEYQIVDVSEASLIPFELANLHDVPLPSAGNNWLDTDIIPLKPPTTIRIEVAVSNSGIFSATITNDGNTQEVLFNATSGPELVENGVYIFELLVHKGDSINFRYSTDNGKIKILRIQEIDASTA